EALPMTLGLSKMPDEIYRAIEQLPESLNFAGLRLRARGLAYGAEISSGLYEQLTDRLVTCVGKVHSEEAVYSTSIIRSFNGIGGQRADGISKKVGLLLKSEDITVRERAAYALGKIGGEEAVAALIEALKSKDIYVRRRAAYVLGKLGREEVVTAVAALIGALKDQDLAMRERAAYALGGVGGVGAAAALMEALKDVGIFVRSH